MFESLKRTFSVGRDVNIQPTRGTCSVLDYPIPYPNLIKHWIKPKVFQQITMTTTSKDRGSGTEANWMTTAICPSPLS